MKNQTHSYTNVNHQKKPPQKTEPFFPVYENNYQRPKRNQETTDFDPKLLTQEKISNSQNNTTKKFSQGKKMKPKQSDTNISEDKNAIKIESKKVDEKPQNKNTENPQSIKQGQLVNQNQKPKRKKKNIAIVSIAWAKPLRKIIKGANIEKDKKEKNKIEEKKKEIVLPETQEKQKKVKEK